MLAPGGDRWLPLDKEAGQERQTCRNSPRNGPAPVHRVQGGKVQEASQGWHLNEQQGAGQRAHADEPGQAGTQAAEER